MSEKIKITDNVQWETARSHDALSAFPEAAIGRLAMAGIDGVVRNADLKGLARHISHRVGAVGSMGKVYELREDPDILVKVHGQPFTYTGINVALQDGLSGHGTVRTPEYLGTLIADNGAQATLMTRAPGVELASIDTKGRDIRSDGLATNLQATASNALASVGVDPNLAHWDWNHNNLFVPEGTRNWEHIGNVPVTIIDQQANQFGGVHEWESLARPAFDPSQRDPRDIAAEQAAEEAIAKWEAIAR